MKTWVRFQQGDAVKFGTLEGDTISVYNGNMFDNPQPAGESVKLADVKLLTPCSPSKMILLWNNFYALSAKLGVAIPEEPLYLLKPSTAYIADGDVVRKPNSYDGKVVYEGELGIVIGKRCKEVSEADAKDYIFGYTCSNDVTAGQLIQKDPTFAQWTRAKGFDTFGSFRPGYRFRYRQSEHAGHQNHSERSGTPELSCQRHDFPAVQARQHDFP